MSWIHIKNHVHNRISKIVHNFEQNYQNHAHTPTHPPTGHEPIRTTRALDGVCAIAGRGREK